MCRTCAVLLVVIAASVGWMQCSTPPAQPSAEALLAESCRFLWEAQGEDGGWHSETHGLLRGGQAWTTFVLHALLEAPLEACDRSEDDVERALAFIRNHVNEEGVVGLSDPDLLEYPNYATAYAVRVLARYGEEADGPLVEQMVRYLLGQQFAEHRGFEPGDPAYGSWGFGEQHLLPGRTGHVDLSHTRRVLQALHDAGLDTLETYRKAEAFLRLVQKHPHDPRLQAAGLDTLYDGGFYASPVVPGVNKSAAVAGAPPELPL
ncbi:MAG: prenyltransferase/squalene oxidase repeat-containing protein, partial [Rhodothermales bacterium]